MPLCFAGQRCRVDGVNWHAVGETAFPAAALAQVGLVAIGDLDRTIYPGAYTEGTAIRFASFDL